MYNARVIRHVFDSLTRKDKCVNDFYFNVNVHCRAVYCYEVLEILKS